MSEEVNESELDRRGIFNARSLADELKRKAAAGGERYPIGFSYDETAGMLGAGELGLVLARAGVGKSTFMPAMVSRTAHVPTVFFTLEMPPAQVTAWLLCATYDLSIPARDMVYVLDPSNDDPRLPEALHALESFVERYPNFWVIDPSGRTIRSFMEDLDAIWEASGVKPVRAVIDHLGLMDGAQGYEGTVNMSANLKRWARTDNIAVIAFQQIPRGSVGDGKTKDNGHIPPTMGSGAFGGEADADYMWGLYQPQRDPKFRAPMAQMTAEYTSVANVTFMNLVKNRNTGETNERGIKLHYSHHSHRITEKGETYVPPPLKGQE